MLLDFFQLREQPFSVSPHPSYLYSSRNRSEALASLTHAAAFPTGVFALLGAPGVGKTTLLNQFLGNLPAATRAILLPHASFSTDELLNYLLREIAGIPSDRTLPTVSHEVPELLSAEMRAGRSYILVADNAEQLNATSLETICGLADSGTGLSLILIGRPVLQDKLQHNPATLSFVTKSLEPLSGPETAAYIQHRLHVAGHPGIGLFEREALALVAERSHGIPRNINQICFRALLEAYATGCRTLSPEIIEKAAEKLEFFEVPRAQSVKPSQPKTILPRGPRVPLRTHPQPRKRISLPALAGQGLLRRAAVAALAATTLVLPYLAAKRISTATRPSDPAPPIASQINSPSTDRPSPDVLPSRTGTSGEFTIRTDNSPEPILAAPPAQPIRLASRSSGHDLVQRIPVNESLERIATDSPRLSLARELGLKINRIAIDPGHGGYDTGTIGPSGLMEKDLCLDVALRLGRMIKEHIPGAEVIYTRTDDRYIPLEERTAMANDAQADLFISIHANSSDVRQIRGVETYYVSLAASPEAREIATRENAVGDAALHNLPDLIKKITRNENLAESRQLASDIQNSLSQRLQLVSRQEANRGVKRAPFIVLTDANMPAVLSEISFLSNPADEKLLSDNEQRRRVTEGLYGGILTYLGTLPSRTLPEYTSGRTASRQLLQTDGLR